MYLYINRYIFIQTYTYRERGARGCASLLCLLPIRQIRILKVGVGARVNPRASESESEMGRRRVDLYTRLSLLILCGTYYNNGGSGGNIILRDSVGNDRGAGCLNEGWVRK